MSDLALRCRDAVVGGGTTQTLSIWRSNSGLRGGTLRRGFFRLQVRIGVLGRHQPDVVSHVRHDQYLRGLPTTTPAIPQPHRPSQRRGGCAAHQRAQELRNQGQRSVDVPKGSPLHRDTMILANTCPGAQTEYVQKYANKDAADDAGAESEDDDGLSSVASFDDEDEEPAGQMDDV